MTDFQSIAPLAHPDSFFIGGEWVAPSTDARIEVITPSTEEVYVRVAEAQEADIEIPLSEWNLPDHGALLVHDLLHDRHFTWTGKRQRIRLDPLGLPYAIWRIAPFGDA